MGINKDDNNQSISDLDNTAFDDMTFDDMNFDDEIPESKENKTEKTLHETNTHVNKTDSANKINKCNEGNEGNKVTKENTTNKTEQNDAIIDISNEDNSELLNINKKELNNKKSKKRKEMEKALAQESVNSKKKISKLLLIPLALVIILIVAIVIFMNRTINSDKHIIIADNTPIVNTETESLDNIDATETVEENTIPKLKLGDSARISMVVNTKLDSDTEYTDHESYIELKYSNVVIGYDNVKEYVDKYNESSNNKIKLANKEDFYNSSNDVELVMYDIELLVPDSFPTNDTKHGYTGIQPDIDVKIVGTDKEDSIITKLYEYDIPSLSSISDDVSEIFVGNTYHLRYIATMPLGINDENYSITLNYNDGRNSKNFILNGIEIKA